MASTLPGFGRDKSGSERHYRTLAETAVIAAQRLGIGEDNGL